MRGGGDVWQALADGYAVTKIGLLVAKFDASSNQFEKWTVDSWETINEVDKDREISTRNSGHGFSAWTPVDDDSFYVPGVAVKSYSYSGGASAFKYSAAVADMKSERPWMKLALYA